MTGSSGAAVAAAVTAASISTLALDGEMIWSVAVPIVASWFGLIGIGVLGERPVAHIMRQVAGAAMLGGVVGIVAISVITALKVEGISAALVTLTIAVSPAVAWRTLGQAGPRVIDAGLAALGLERRTERDEDDDT